ncbi:MAG: sulfotransferase domain-containing protein [Myxococcales bacterium]|nr:sulfotransferase domain-containing protein [Myxococcales bacterium]
MKDVIPNYFIVGAHKCATTFMAEHLRKHPEVFMTEPKEPQHFARDISPESSRWIDPEAYWDLFRSVKGEKAIGEASTWYLYSEVAAAGIHRVNPEARIIIMLRNPVDFLYSMHSELLFGRQEPVEDFERAIELDYRARRALGTRPASIFACGFEYRKAARFSYQVERYLTRFGSERVHFVLLDDVRASPENAYAGVLRFLGVDDSFKPEFEVTNANKTVRFPALIDIVQSRSTLKSIVARSLPPSVRRQLLDLLVFKVATKPARRPPMRPELRARLTADYADEVRALSAMIGRDLSAWLPDASASRGVPHGG